MNLTKSFFTAAALSALAATSHAQMASDATPMIPGMMPGTTPGFVRPPADTLAAPMPANNTGMMMMPPTGNMMMGAPTTTVTTTTTPGMMMPMAMMSAQDQLFCLRAAEGNLAEITFARLALSKSRNASVRQTAQSILMGHTKAQSDLMALQKAKNITMMPMLSATHMAVQDALQKANGEVFDRMYMAGQTSDHENTIALFSSEINAGTDADLKRYASQYLPDIVGHTILIYNVARQVNAPGSAMRPMMPPVPPGVTPMIMGQPINMTSSMTVSDSINMKLMQMPKM